MSKICGSCGSVNEDTNVSCSVCGSSLGENSSNNQTYNATVVGQEREIGGGEKFGWTALGCCVPIAGLILWLVWAKDKPQQSKCCRNGFLAYAICFALYLICVFGVAFFGTLINLG